MRLTQIKLSGFKSFVDSTSFRIPGQLIGVVGPNGCGKSNIIDAARWVLGESKASELRGESMQDVIFNGSGHRKPASRASVELVFDNPEGRAGGQWSQYAEIAVRRVLTRDGTSTYYINNQVVRRRDIQDIFLGTGLGPRAYAIIGQGMISRMIEAKPEELRVFLEEAAGVSKYKERRRETENRLSDTRENLTRVEDILRELGANLNKLEAQALVAQQYRDLEQEQKQKQQWLWLLRHDEAQAEQERNQRSVSELQLRLEAKTADLRRLEAALEEMRASHYGAGDRVHAVQGELYQAQAAVNQFESEIRFVVESRARLETQLTELAAQAEHWSHQKALHEQQVNETRARAETLGADLTGARARHQDQAARIPHATAAWDASQQRANDARAAVAQIEQALQVESAHQRNADRNLQGLTARRERLAQERLGLAGPELARIEMLQAELAQVQAQLQSRGLELQQAETALAGIELARQEALDRVTRESGEAAHTDARLTALRQLQESVQTHDKVKPWLEKHELTGLPRLWQRLHIESGWETALESVLRERIAALEVSQLDWTRGFFSDAPPAKLAFFGGQGSTAVTPDTMPGLTSLVSRLKLDDPALRALLSDWLANIYLCDTEEEALTRRGELPPAGVFVLRSGHIVGRNSVRFYASDSEQAGMLARQQEIESLAKQSKAQAFIADEAKSKAVQAEAVLAQASAKLTDLRQTVLDVTRAVHAKELELQRLVQEREQVSARSGQIGAQLGEIEEEAARELALRTESESRFENLDTELARVQEDFETQQQLQEADRAALEAAREAARTLEREVQELEFEARNSAQRSAELSRNIALDIQESDRIAALCASTGSELQALSDTLAQESLQQALGSRAAQEEALARARTELDSLTAQLRTSDEDRLRTERDLDPLRTKITELQLKEQAARLNQEQYLEQLTQSQINIESLRGQLAASDGPRPRPQALQTEITQLGQAIEALGAVNLAALAELETARERKSFLDAQTGDLNEAITTLEDAIRKIDRETRALLQDTFDAVNRHFGELFPALFGGGEARLVMTGNEILDAGVQVMAQPPGKKNSTIHLLSGGEKALTATALVFAMFQLNPAPFCLLDEVDAPLDDANTDRFCELVKRMSVQTQFLFISHNKIAMEMANQLIGVTMQEQGVSRIVAVDMETAAALTSAPALEKVA